MGIILRTSQAHWDLVKVGIDVGRNNPGAADQLLD